MKKYIITISILLVLVLICFAGYLVYSKINSEPTVETLKRKVNEELNYLDTNIVSLINSFNNITYSNYKVVEETVPISNSASNSSSESSSGGSSSQQQGGQNGDNSTESSNIITNTKVVPNSILTNSNNDVNWDYIKQETEKMYTTWTTILIDLNSLNINNDNLLKFNNTLDELTQVLEKKDKAKAVAKVAELYSLLPLYIKDYSNDRNMLSVYNTKSNILFAYALLEYDNKATEVKNYVTKAKNEFSYIVNNPSENSENITNVNKAYVELNELEKDVTIKEKKLFYIHYKNLLQELDAI